MSSAPPRGKRFSRSVRMMATTYMINARSAVLEETIAFFSLIKEPNGPSS
jgi:hypothetical protein